MVFYLKYHSHDIEKLHQLIGEFFNNVYKKNITVFDTSLLPTWYLTTPNRMVSMEGELTKFLNFPETVKNEIIEAFLVCEDVEALFSCEQATYVHQPVALDFRKLKDDGTVDNSIERYLISLFVDTLYEGQLGKKDSTFSKKIGSNIGSHYLGLKNESSFYDEDFNLCPFCGIEPLKLLESEGRPDYDHLLPKGDSLYIFSAINIKNLIPMGDHCNSKKSSKNLLFTDVNRTVKTIAFYPYSLSPNPFELYNIELSCTDTPKFSNSWKGNWNIDIKPNDPLDTITLAKISSWDRVFNIKARYCEYIQDHLKSIINKILKTIDSSINDLLNEVKTKLQYRLDNFYKYEYLFVSTEEGLIPTRNLILWFLSNDNFLMSYLEQKKKIQANDIDMSMLEL
ncbi:hypothetical protein [Pedobacter roseus]|uniref:HNH endonuclease n=1 Tax=Pedobacter roseus TaxID=336820 RepID=A0A7G9QH78_9SPHI|nr:hypothetical protein [Pedobacter roseus]QNN42703.1 hypothetical protein H9L23_00865 [Pedobacter roseus]